MDLTNELLMELWDLYKHNVGPTKKEIVAEQLVKLFEEYGADPEDMMELKGEDRHLDIAFNNLYEDEEEFLDDEDYDI